MQRKTILQTFSLWLALPTLAALAGCNATVTATPNPVSAGQPVQLSFSVSGVGGNNAKGHKQAKLTQDPAGAIPDLPKQVRLDYVGPGYYGGGDFSGVIGITAPAVPGSVTITATTKDTGNDPYISASTVLVVE